MTQQESRSGQQSAAGEAREQVSATSHRAAQVGGGVAQGAMAQGRQTAAEGAQQARNLLGQASSQVQQQAGMRQKEAAQRLRTLGDQLQSMSGQAGPGMAEDLVRQASDRAHRVAEWLEHREPGAVVEEVRDYARRHPGLFLAGAALAGVIAGRLTRNLAGGGGDGQPAEQGGQPAGRGGPQFGMASMEQEAPRPDGHSGQPGTGTPDAERREVGP
ncbi:hypothetical protein AB0J86_17485 [Micromonospora sp. NPDC049559]|uniref:hypothetical protein n=1 Tax=Micromonospora sp. NPDC049559 TaxID=3155923 RepID=UPI0034381004